MELKKGMEVCISIKGNKLASGKIIIVTAVSVLINPDKYTKQRMDKLFHNRDGKSVLNILWANIKEIYSEEW